MSHNEKFEELAALQALGLPLGEEAVEFARHLEEGCDTCEELVRSYREASTALAVEAPLRQPRREVREQILASLGPSPALIRPSTSGRFARVLFGLAAVLLLVIIATDDLRLRRQREELASRTVQLSENLENARRNLAREDLRVRVLESDDVRILLLEGKDPQPSARAKVFWSEKAKRGIILAGNLAPLPPEKQYELWVFAEGKPVAAGVFEADSAGRALFESPDLSRTAEAQNFAVTIEPRGGTSQPTGPIVLAGKPS